MNHVVMGVDSSTQSCTVELREAESGALVSTGRSPHPPTYPPVSEQQPQDWWDALVRATRQALAVAAKPVQVISLSVGAQCHGLVVTDARGQVARPAKLWNDTTSGPQAEALVSRYGAAWWAQQMGLVPSAALTITKLVWLAEHEPDALQRLHRIYLPHDWLTYRLVGRHVTDRSDASGTGFFSATTGTWRTDVLAEVVGERDWVSALPHVLEPDEAAGTIARDAADELGISRTAVIGPGGGDQHLAAQGIGLAEGEVAYSLGTSGVVFATSPRSVHDETGSIDGVANVTGGYLPLVCTLNAAKVTDAMARVLGVDHDELSRLALAAPVIPQRPIMAAFLDGERSPRLPQARGMLAGLCSDLTREQLALAAYEGVVLGLERGARRIADFGVPLSGRAIALGGASRSTAYRQILADFSGREVHTVDAPEATARGAAVQAAAVAHGERVSEVTAQWRPTTHSVTVPAADRSSVFTRYERLADLQLQGQEF